MQAITESPGRWDPDMKPIVKWAAEGAKEREDLSILRREGMRQLPGVCWYFAKVRRSCLRTKVAPRIRFIRP